ncbi:GTPase IMAP family member 6-like [Boleophthalmus pectinirostris]|uniref:GTPase IMAP family member 6-like n=1 Tax=Boleophthalmus pectinirostris TaxID=150288 RepID=UPI00242F9FBF|nr:GTPase IMAP family member 6-like [Boleophthalmus pectinirostris]
MAQMLRLVLLGGSAVGKSSSGNTILGRRVFESRPSLRPVTTLVSEHTEQVHGLQVSVLDTPGILNPNARQLIQPVCEEHLHRPGSVFLVVLKVGQDLLRAEPGSAEDGGAAGSRGSETQSAALHLRSRFRGDESGGLHL